MNRKAHRERRKKFTLTSPGSAVRIEKAPAEACLTSCENSSLCVFGLQLEIDGLDVTGAFVKGSPLIAGNFGCTPVAGLSAMSPTFSGQRLGRIIFNPTVIMKTDGFRLAEESSHSIKEGRNLLTTFLARGSFIALLRSQVDAAIPESHLRVSTSVDLPLSAQAKDVFERAAEESDRRGDPSIRIIHLLPGLGREPATEGAFPVGDQVVDLPAYFGEFRFHLSVIDADYNGSPRRRGRSGVCRLGSP